MSAKCRLHNLFMIAALTVGLVFLIIPVKPTQAVSDTLVISQFQVGGATTSDEFIEIHNVSGYPQDIAGYKLAYRTLAGSTDYVLLTWATSTTIPAGGYYLIAAAPGYDGLTAADSAFGDGGGGKLSSYAGGVGLRDAANALVDSVGYGIATNIFVETAPTPVPPANLSKSRLGDGCTDNDNNLNDYMLANPANPRNSSSPAVYCVPPDIAPSVTSTNPSNTDTNVQPDVSISIDFSEPVTINPEDFFHIYCDSVEHTGTLNGGESSYTIDPDVDMPNNAICEVTIHAAAVVDQDGPPDPMITDYVFIFTIESGDDPPEAVSTIPRLNGTDVALDSNISITFNEPVNLDSDWFTLSCSVSGSHSGVETGYEPGTEFTINPAENFFVEETCTVTIIATKVHDDDVIDPPDNPASDYFWSFTTVGEAGDIHIHDIQGSGHLSPLDGATVTDVPGIVTALTSQGFYFQEPNPDSSNDTSEGVYVYSGSVPAVFIGDYVYVSGTVMEYQSVDFPNDLHLTEIVNPGLIVTHINAGNVLPDPVVLGDGGRVVPDKVIHTASEIGIETGDSFNQLTDAIDLYESLEGMRVQINAARVVAPTNWYGETAVVGDNGIHAGMFNGRGGLVIAADDFNPERLLLDNQVMTYPPMLTGQSSAVPLYGVMTYAFSNYKIEVTESINFGSKIYEPEFARQRLDTELTIASFNLLDLKPNDGLRYDSLATQIINNLHSPDILVLEEVEDNSGDSNNGVVAADMTLTTLTSAIRSAGGPDYEYRQINPVDLADGGTPGGNIRVAFLFNPARVTFIDRVAGDATTATLPALISGEVQLSHSPGRVDPTNGAWLDSRKPLAGEFLFLGQKIFVIGCHLNSRRDDTPLFGLTQPPVLISEAQRIAQADAINVFVDSILALDPEAKVVVAGDMNDFTFSKPLSHLTGFGGEKIMTNLYDLLPASERYSYAYDGNFQAMDHIFVTNNLFERPDTIAFDVVHINSDNAYATRASDHDPILVYLNLGVYHIALPMVVKSP